METFTVQTCCLSEWGGGRKGLVCHTRPACGRTRGGVREGKVEEVSGVRGTF